MFVRMGVTAVWVQPLCQSHCCYAAWFIVGRFDPFLMAEFLLFLLYWSEDRGVQDPSDGPLVVCSKQDRVC
jgi:hypothetical protein